jgi:hypothetical protein
LSARYQPGKIGNSMKVLHKIALAFLSCATISPVAAQDIKNCKDYACIWDVAYNPTITVDYTLTDRRYLITLAFKSMTPVSLDLAGPNQYFGYDLIRDAGGSYHEQYNQTADGSGFTFEQVGYVPNSGDQLGLVQYSFISAPTYNNCLEAGPIGAVCGRRFDYWGNAVPLQLTALAPVDYSDAATESRMVFVYGSVTPVPEPAAWAMMILGTGLAGGSMRLRTRRRAPRMA